MGHRFRTGTPGFPSRALSACLCVEFCVDLRCERSHSAFSQIARGCDILRFEPHVAFLLEINRYRRVIFDMAQRTDTIIAT